MQLVQLDRLTDGCTAYGFTYFSPDFPLRSPGFSKPTLNMLTNAAAASVTKAQSVRRDCGST